MNSNYYVYLYLRENGTPYYCGKGKVFSEEHRNNLSKARKGKPLTEAHCIALKKPRSEEAKLNMSRGCMGRKISEATKAKISETLKARSNLKSS